ncbi:unnamed protein product [Calypogeia fissa]
MVKAKALFQQMHKKWLEFVYEGAWKILKVSQVANWCKMKQETYCESYEAEGEQSVVGESFADGGSVVAKVEEESPEKEFATPKMVTKRPLGNMKSKELAAIEQKS